MTHPPRSIKKVKKYHYDYSRVRELAEIGFSMSEIGRRLKIPPENIRYYVISENISVIEGRFGKHGKSSNHAIF